MKKNSFLVVLATLAASPAFAQEASAAGGSHGMIALAAAIAISIPTALTAHAATPPASHAAAPLTAHAATPHAAGAGVAHATMPERPAADPIQLVTDAIRRGLDPAADGQARAAAVAACRTVLASLGEPAAPPVPLAPPPPATPIAAVVETLRKLSPDQLFDLAIQRLRAALPPDANLASPETRFQLIQIPLPGAGR